MLHFSFSIVFINKYMAGKCKALLFKKENYPMYQKQPVAVVLQTRLDAVQVKSSE